IHDGRVGYRVGKLVAVRRVGQVGHQFEIEDEALADLRLVLHHAVMGVDDEAADENRVAHRACSMAAATRSACAVSATSWARTIAARAARSSEGAKNAAMSVMMSSAGSAAVRLCMITIGTRRAATSGAICGSRCSPQTSLTIAAP